MAETRGRAAPCLAWPPGRPWLRLVADDYGQHAGIDRAVLALGARGRLHGTSCLVNGPRWGEAARGLVDLPDGFSVGLHFNLTEGEPLSTDLRRHWPRLPGLGSLLLRAAAGALPRAAIAAEWRAQLEAYTAARDGRAPDHVDGHQHVHALPGVRESMLQALDGWGRPVAVRNTGRLAGPGGALKQAVIERAGGRALQAALARRGWAHNPVLLGAYPLRAEDDYPALMRQWLAIARRASAGTADGGGGHDPALGTPLLFCHPAESAPPDDPIGPARLKEGVYLAGPGFEEDLLAATRGHREGAGSAATAADPGADRVSGRSTAG